MIDVSEVKDVINNCFTQIEGIKECIAELPSEARL